MWKRPDLLVNQTIDLIKLCCTKFLLLIMYLLFIIQLVSFTLVMSSWQSTVCPSAGSPTQVWSSSYAQQGILLL